MWREHAAHLHWQLYPGLRQPLAGGCPQNYDTATQGAVLEHAKGAHKQTPHCLWNKFHMDTNGLVYKYVAVRGER